VPYSPITDSEDPRAVALSKVAKMVLLNDLDDVDWVRDVHVPSLPVVGAVVVVGNEDCPDGFLVYKAKDPLVTDVPIIYLRDLEEEECIPPVEVRHGP
jgi:hypothetical protein